MPAGSTYTPIATTTLSTSTATVTFSSISGSYTDLVLICNIAQAAGNNSLRIRYNSDTGTNYSRTYILGNGTSATSARTTSDVSGYLSEVTGSTTLEFAVIANIFNYSNTTTYKTHLSRSNRASSGVDATVGLWSSTSAITRIDLAMGGSFPTNNFASGSTFTLYGIASA